MTNKLTHTNGQDLEVVEVEQAEVDRVYDPPLPRPNDRDSGELASIDAAYREALFRLCDLLHRYPRLKDESEIVRAIELTGQVRDIIEGLPTSEDYEARQIFDKARQRETCGKIISVEYDFTTHCDLEKGHDPATRCSTFSERFERAEFERRIRRRQRALPIPAD